MEKIAKLICSMKKFDENYMCNCGCSDDVMCDFISELHDTFSNVEEVMEYASYIKSLDPEVFVDNNYKDVEHDNDDIRFAIESIFKSDIEAKEIKLDYNLVSKYIDDCPSLIIYLDNITDEEIISLGVINPSILYSLNSFSIDTLKSIMRENAKTSLVIDCDIMDLDLVGNTYLYENKNRFLEDKELYDLYIEGLKLHLRDNVTDYIQLSDIARNDVSLAEFVLDIEPKLIPYTEENVHNDKDVMMKMISLDKENVYYLSDSLKEDSDIKKLLED